MLKEFEEPIKETRVESIFDFVNQFNALKEVEQIWQIKDMEDWNYPDCDQSCIEEILAKRKELYRVVYIDDCNEDHFIIEEYETKE